MSSPRPVHTPDRDDEPRDIHVDPMSLRHVEEEEPVRLESSEEEEQEEPVRLESSEEEEQEEPVRLESSEEEEPEEEPVELESSEPEEEDPEEESEEEAEDTPSTLPSVRPREPSFRPYRPYPNGPRMMYTPRKRVRIPEPFPIFRDDPYLPSTSSASRQLPEPPTHPAVSLLTARTDRHEADIELLQDGLELLPGPEHFEEIHREIETFRTDHHSLRDQHERLEGRVAGGAERLDEMERQVRMFGEQLTDLRSMMEEMRDSISHITRGLPRPRRGD